MIDKEKGRERGRMRGYMSVGWSNRRTITYKKMQRGD